MIIGYFAKVDLATALQRRIHARAGGGSAPAPALQPAFGARTAHLQGLSSGSVLSPAHSSTHGSVPRHGDTAKVKAP